MFFNSNWRQDTVEEMQNKLKEMHADSEALRLDLSAHSAELLILLQSHPCSTMVLENKELLLIFHKPTPKKIKNEIGELVKKVAVIHSEVEELKKAIETATKNIISYTRGARGLDMFSDEEIN